MIRVDINTIVCGDWISVLKELPDRVFQTGITSPPYFGLRNYGVEGQLGLESTLEEYVAKLVEGFREVKRVLRDDGTLWLNLGDSYAANRSYQVNGTKQVNGSQPNHGAKVPAGLKPKDLCGIPWRVAFALQADGWWLRSDIIWHKPNCMPESVRDRPTKAHEYVFLLAKSKRYFYDADAIRQPHKEVSIKRQMRAVSKHHKNINGAPGQTPHTIARPRPNIKGLRTALEALDEGTALHPAGRNKRTVWTIATHPFKEAHFATFPPKLIEPMIKAGTSERGACPKCGKAWVRVVKRQRSPIVDNYCPKDKVRISMGLQSTKTGLAQPGWRKRRKASLETLGWRPACSCWKDACDERGLTYDNDYEHFNHLSEWLPELAPVPCVVLDPFIGAGTTALVAEQLGRNWFGIELNPDYVQMALERVGADRKKRAQLKLAL